MKRIDVAVAEYQRGEPVAVCLEKTSGSRLYSELESRNIPLRVGRYGAHELLTAMQDGGVRITHDRIDHSIGEAMLYGRVVERRQLAPNFFEFHVRP